MATIANAIDFFSEEFLSMLTGAVKNEQQRNHSHTYTNQNGLRAMLFATYFVMFAVTMYAHDIALIQWREGWSYLSFAYFCGCACEFQGLLFLAMKVHASKSVAGVSSQTLALIVISLSFRVMCTTIFEGYLPVDKSGDRMVQMLDGLSLVTACYLLHAARKKYVHTYQEEADEMSIFPILASSAILCTCIHGALNRNWAFDALWAFSLNVEVFQLVPQLFMMAKIGGEVDTATAHYVLNIVGACVCRFVFWIWAVPGCKELSTPDGYAWNMEMGGYYILCAYALQTLISLDFLYHYVVSVYRGQKSIYLPKAGEEI